MLVEELRNETMIVLADSDVVLYAIEAMLKPCASENSCIELSKEVLEQSITQGNNFINKGDYLHIVNPEEKIELVLRPIKNQQGRYIVDKFNSNSLSYDFNKDLALTTTIKAARVMTRDEYKKLKQPNAKR